MAQWFTQYDLFGFPIEQAVIGDCDLSVVFVGGEWQWPVRRDGCDLAEGQARACLAAKQQAEAVTLRFLNVVARAA
jgi:hypothetical protein